MRRRILILAAVLASIKTFREEASVVADKADQIKAQYAKYFKV